MAPFTEPGLRTQLGRWGIETLAADLIAPGAPGGLPDAPNAIHMVARNFGSTGNEALSWATTTFLQGLVAKHFARSRIVTLSRDNVSS